MNQGYFQAQVKATPVSVSAGGTPLYDVFVRVLDAGPQYRLGDIRIINASVFSAPALRELFPIERGEVYSREKIAKGLEELRRVYGSHGYINFTPVPSAQFENQNAIANLKSMLTKASSSDCAVSRSLV